MGKLFCIGDKVQGKEDSVMEKRSIMWYGCRYEVERIDDNYFNVTIYDLDTDGEWVVYCEAVRFHKDVLNGFFGDTIYGAVFK